MDKKIFFPCFCTMLEGLDTASTEEILQTPTVQVRLGEDLFREVSRLCSEAHLAEGGPEKEQDVVLHQAEILSDSSNEYRVYAALLQRDSAIFYIAGRTEQAIEAGQKGILILSWIPGRTLIDLDLVIMDPKNPMALMKEVYYSCGMGVLGLGDQETLMIFEQEQGYQVHQFFGGGHVNGGSYLDPQKIPQPTSRDLRPMYDFCPKLSRKNDPIRKEG